MTPNLIAPTAKLSEAEALERAEVLRVTTRPAASRPIIYQNFTDYADFQRDWQRMMVREAR